MKKVVVNLTVLASFLLICQFSFAHGAVGGEFRLVLELEADSLFLYAEFENPDSVNLFLQRNAAAINLKGSIIQHRVTSSISHVRYRHILKSALS